MNFNINLKKLREENNLTQKELANKIGIARQTYNHYEIGENIIPLKHLNSIANFYNVSIDYIFGFTKQKVYKNYTKKIDIIKSSKRLKEWRTSNKITQEQIANKLKTYHTVVVDYEHARNLIATAFLYEISRSYNISADYLLGKIDKKITFKKETI